MKKSLLLITILLFSLFVSGAGTDKIAPRSVKNIAPTLQTPQAITSPYASDRIIVKFKEGKGDVGSFKGRNSISILNSKYGASLEKLVTKTFNKDLDRLYILKVPRNSDIKQIVEDYNNNPDVEYAEPDYVVHALETPNDPYFYLQWGLNNSGQLSGTPGADIDALAAWDVTNGSEDVVVAVIDTGVDYTHPDLEDNIWTNPVDGSHGWDFYNYDNDPMDDNGHGTHCAGIIGAVGNNSVGVVGVNWRVKIAALKFLDEDGYGYLSDAISAINYANLMGFKILSNSWGCTGSSCYSKALYDAIKGYNIPDFEAPLFIAAAGNYGLNNDLTPTYPCNYNLPNIICVAATDNNDSLASFSNYGPTTVHIGAPGHYIYSTVPTGSCELCNSTGYTYLSGTSMATPFVSGAAALIKSKYPDLNVSQIKARILYSADKIDSLNGKVVSNGRLNVYNALHEDDTPPAAISDLAVVSTGVLNVTLNWTAVGDDENEGNATYYEIRYSTSEINESNFNYATLASGAPTPGENGSTETFVVEGLMPETTYYFAIKVYDEVGNPSEISNVVSTTTEELPTIPGCDYLIYSSNYITNQNNSVYCLLGNVVSNTYGVVFANYTENTTLDCRNFTIDGSSNYFGVYISYYSKNNTVKNCKVEGFYAGVVLDGLSGGNNITNVAADSNYYGAVLHYSNNNTLSNITANSNTYGVRMQYSSNNTGRDITANSNSYGVSLYLTTYSTLRGITAVNNSDDGLYLSAADYNKFENVYLSGYADTSNDGIVYSYGSWHDEFVNVTIANASASGFYLRYAINNTIRDSRITNCGSYGVYLYSSGSTPTRIYNNFFNNTKNINITGTVYSNYWNRTRSGGSRVYLYGAIGGNYWTTPTANGYSDSCLDVNTDGFCDSPYDVLNNRACRAGVNCSNNTDYLPYSSQGTGLVGYWNLNEGTGTTANDSSGNGNTGTISGATWTSGKYGNALLFNGQSTNNVSCGNSSVLRDFTQLTISLWFKTSNTSLTGARTIVARWNAAAGQRSYAINQETNNKISFYLRKSDDSASITVTSNSPIDTNWHHIAGVWNGTHMMLYIDGVLQSDIKAISAIQPSIAKFYIGRQQGGAVIYGRVDDVRVYGRALSESEIRDLYQ